MLVVLKIYALQKLTKGQTAAVWQEAQLPVLLSSCGVPNICKIHWAFQQHGVLVLVQQYCERVPLWPFTPMAFPLRLYSQMPQNGPRLHKGVTGTCSQQLLYRHSYRNK
jgi:hypothetical protein